ncbi:MAG TPA: dihydrodipicolinate synthase family protein [Bryobacteraceae bacterium]|nr:dihydrodipicolinate synthase family protein [Bryobacteraceae bacterium]
MKTTPVQLSDRQGVIAVPPLCRNSAGAFDWEQNQRVVNHIQAGGVTRLMYGGNAFLYHLTLAEYGQMLEWLTSLSNDLWCIPAAGPSFGRLMDQAPLLRIHKFPCVMALPCADPRDARGLEDGLRRFSSEAETPLIVYLKEENNFGSDLLAGLDAVARLVADGICVGIKYAVVRKDPSEDAYLSNLLERVDRQLVISGIGERPAIVHTRQFQLAGFTSGSVCVAPDKTQAIFDALAAGDDAKAAAIREKFLEHEDYRDAWGPARVLHASLALAGIADTGPIPPFVSALSEEQQAQLRPAAIRLRGE